jgi:hypothetical protein
MAPKVFVSGRSQYSSRTPPTHIQIASMPHQGPSVPISDPSLPCLRLLAGQALTIYGECYQDCRESDQVEEEQ